MLNNLLFFIPHIFPILFVCTHLRASHPNASNARRINASINQIDLGYYQNTSLRVRGQAPATRMQVSPKTDPCRWRLAGSSSRLHESSEEGQRH